MLVDVKRCAAVVAAAECGTMSAAAKKLGYTPSGIIRLVDSLEEELGFSVLVRKTTGVELTPEGRRMLPLFEQITAADEQVRQTAARIRGMSEGAIVIGVQSNVASYWLPDVLADFQTRYPNLQVRVVEEGTDQLRRLLEQRRIDCMVFYEGHAKLDWIRLGRCELVAWVPAVSHLAQNSSVLLAELQGEPFIRIHPADETYEEKILREKSVEPNVRFATDDTFTAFRMVSAGLGCTLCMGGIADGFEGDVRVMPLSPQRFFEFGIATLPGSVFSPAMEEFVSVAQEHAGDWPILSEA